MKKNKNYEMPQIEIVMFKTDRKILLDYIEDDGDIIYRDNESEPDVELEIPTGSNGELPWM